MNVCVFCSSKMIFPKIVLQQAEKFCHELVRRDFGFVYGGAACGLMGYLADQIINLGGKSLGIIPKEAFKDEVAHQGLTELIQTQDLLDRKRLLMEHSQAFIIFPGGIGTMDEALEVITWKTIYHFKKPILFFNWEGFWDPFLDMLKIYENKNLFYERTMKSFKVANNLDHLFKELDRAG